MGKKSLTDKMLKDKIRKSLIEKRKNILDNNKKSDIIIEKLLETEEYKRAKKIMFYYSLPTEVQTIKIIRKELSKKEKTIFLPYCPKKNIMKASQIKEIELVKGSYGVYEPKNKIGNKETIDLIIVPGVGFDNSGNRIGFGKGYYDKFLSHNPNSKIIGLAFDELLVDSIPTEPHDKKVDIIITDKKIVRCS